jgi:hypothetical protein
MAAAFACAAGSPRLTLRQTRIHGSSRGSWNTAARAGGTVTLPLSTRSRPARLRSRVVLPEPLRPSKATNSPG